MATRPLGSPLRGVLLSLTFVLFVGCNEPSVIKSITGSKPSGDGEAKAAKLYPKFASWNGESHSEPGEYLALSQENAASLIGRFKVNRCGLEDSVDDHRELALAIVEYCAFGETDRLNALNVQPFGVGPPFSEDLAVRRESSPNLFWLGLNPEACAITISPPDIECEEAEGVNRLFHRKPENSKKVKPGDTLVSIRFNVLHYPGVKNRIEMHFVQEAHTRQFLILGMSHTNYATSQ